jgi:hypothetical protein
MEITEVKIINKHLKELLTSNGQKLNQIDMLFWSVSFKAQSNYGNSETFISFYKAVCKKFKVNPLLSKGHGMTSEKGSNVKKDGHAVEDILAAEYNLDVTKNNQLKHDLIKNKNPYGSLKTGNRTQWGLHVKNSIPDSIMEYLNSWVDSHISKDKNSSNLSDSARQVMLKMQDFEIKRIFFNWWLTKNENFPFLIIWEEEMKSPIQVSMPDFIETIVNNTEVSVSYSKKNGYGNKITINSVVPSGKSKKPRKITIMEFEYRKDKSSFLLVSTLEKIVRFIYYYNIKQVEVGTDEIN